MPGAGRSLYVPLELVEDLEVLQTRRLAATEALRQPHQQLEGLSAQPQLLYAGHVCDAQPQEAMLHLVGKAHHLRTHIRKLY